MAQSKQHRKSKDKFTMPHRFSMWPDRTRSRFGHVVNFWVEAYQSGVRIVVDGERLTYQRVVGNMTRVFSERRFGYFGTLEEVTPDPWISDMAERVIGDIANLYPKAPKALAPFMGHILIAEGEYDVIGAYAAANGHMLNSLIVSGGFIMAYRGEIEPYKVELRPASQLLRSIKALTFAG